jgi:hypothetical protein
MYIFDQRLSSFLGDVKELKREAELKEMARWPQQAHSAWKRLGAVDRNLLVWQMAANYGADFAKRFLSEVGKRRPQAMVQHYFGRGVGSKPPRLRERGYQLAQKDSVHEWWVHPSGEEVLRNYTDDVPSAPAREAKKPELRSPRCREMDVLTEAICYNAERICKLAAEVDDEQSRASCERARAACTEARQRGKLCL